MIDILPSSDKFMGMKRGAQGLYPWRTLNIGHSFAIHDKTTIKLTSLRTMAYKMGKKLNKRFRVCEHDNCYEIGRLS